ncbi:MAG: CPBP family intramembrane glutamic endopeptidase [Candidatus Krumholzibacteriia bacterium]
MSSRTVEWRHIAFFYVTACGLFWIPFFGSTLAAEGAGAAAWRTIFGIMGPYSPLVAALLTRLLIAREGLRDAHLGFRRVRRHFWLLAVALPFFWNGIQDVAQVIFGFAEVQWAELPRGLYRVPINLFGGLLIFIGEEFGWRSYLLEKLRPLGRWRALAISGVLWSAWHMPLLVLPNGIYGAGKDAAGAAAAALVFILLGFIIGWLYLESGSVWPCVLLHSFNNLISLELFREAWSQKLEPSLFQSSLMALGPILLVWAALFLGGRFGTESKVRP